MSKLGQITKFLLSGLENKSKFEKYISTLPKTDGAVGQLALKIVEGEYCHVLKDKNAARIISLLQQVEPDAVEAAVAKECAKAKGETEVIHITLFGVAALNLFLQLNWTGPLISNDELQAVLGKPLVDNHKLYRRCLSMNGEDVHSSVNAPVLLLIARGVFVSHQHLSTEPTLLWWKMRCASVHQACLQANVPGLKQAYDECDSAVVDAFTKDKNLAEDAVLKAKFLLESGYISANYWQQKKTEENNKQAKTVVKLDSNLTGVLGKRTKFQKFELSQLVLIANSKDEVEVQKAHDFTSSFKTYFPTDVELNDEVLLPKTALSEEQELTPLSSIDQAVLLAECHFIKYNNPSEHELTGYEMVAYLDRLLHAPTSWAILFRCLYFRSQIEYKENHRLDRALQQLEELIAVYQKKPGDESVPLHAHAAVRLNDVFHAGLPPMWEIKRGLADTFTKLKLHKSALDLYEQIEDWERMIEAYIDCGRKSRAEEVIRERIALENEPKMWCYLGDVTQEIEHYTTAWELSKHTYPRAQRCLATVARRESKLEQAITHYQLALDLNPMFPECWFALGWCAMELKQYDVATTALTRDVTLDPDHGDGWNNLAACHMHLKQYKQAFHALDQATRLKRDNWKIWENYLTVAMHLGETQKAVIAFENAVRYKAPDTFEPEKKLETAVLDEKLLSVLTTRVMEDAHKDSFLIQRFQQMLDSVSEKMPNNPTVFESWARVAAACGDKQQTIAYREKQCRALLSQEWLKSEPLFLATAAAVNALIESYLASGTPANARTAKIYLEGILAKTATLPTDASDVMKQGVEDLQATLEKVKTNQPQPKQTQASKARSDWL